MITIDLHDVTLEAHRRVPEASDRLAVFVHGTGSSRHSPRNNHVAELLEHDGVASLLFDLLTEEDAAWLARTLTEENRRVDGPPLRVTPDGLIAPRSRP